MNNRHRIHRRQLFIFSLFLFPWVYFFFDVIHHVSLLNSVVLESKAIERNAFNRTLNYDSMVKTKCLTEKEKPLEAEEGFEYALSHSKTDKKDHRYHQMYGPIFNSLKHKKISFLEIGLHQGDSLKLWKSFFSSAQIYGIDKARPFSYKTISKFKNLTIFLGDQADMKFLQRVVKKIQSEVGQLDFIIDDGGHTMTQQITSFTYLMPLLKPGGYYFIEDLETSYYKDCAGQCYVPCCGGGPVGAKGTTIDMIKSFIDVLNADYMMGTNSMKLVGIGNYSVNPSDHLISEIICQRNICAFRRKF